MPKRHRFLQHTLPAILLAAAGTAQGLDPQHSEDEIIQMLLGQEYSGTPWVFEYREEFVNFMFLREESRRQYTEYFVYMSLQAEKACHNTLGLITIDDKSNALVSADMVHHAPSKRCLSYQEFKNP